MVDVAVGGLVDIAYVAETVFGSTPAAETFTRIREVNSSLSLNKAVYQSEERRSDRQQSDLRHGFRSVDGAIQVEHSLASFDDFLEALLGGTWTAGTTTGVLTSVNVSNTHLTAASGDFITNGFKVGDIFSVSGTGGDNTDGRHVILSVSASTIEVAGSTLATTLAAESSVTIQVVGQKVLVGTTKRSFSVEEYYSDIDWYQLFKGLRVNSGEFSFPPDGLTTINFGFLGRDAADFSSTTVASATADGNSNSPMTFVDGAVYEGGTLLGLVTGLSLNINNGMGNIQVGGSTLTPDIFWGRRAEIGGTITVLFEDPTYYNKFVNETETSIDVRVQDASSFQSAGFLRIRMPRIKYTGGTINKGQDTGIPIELPFVALKPLSTATTDDSSAIVIQRSNS